MAGSPQPSRPLVQQLIEWFGQFNNLWAELAHLFDHAQKASKLCDVGWYLHVGDSFDLVWVDAVCADDVSKEIEILLPNWHFSWFKVTPAAWSRWRVAEVAPYVPAGSSHE